MGQAKLFNTMILGGYLKVCPVVKLENVMIGLKKSLPERAWKMLPENEKAINHGAEIIRKCVNRPMIFSECPACEGRTLFLSLAALCLRWVIKH